jgi:hypothetical protein
MSESTSSPDSPPEPTSEPASDQASSAPATTTTHRGWWRRIGILFVVAALVYLLVAYLLMPDAWKHYVRKHPSLANVPRITHTKGGIPGDPLNVALIGTEDDVKRIMIAARWYPADPLTLKSCLKIAEASVLKRPYDAAPVSNLYLFDRQQDLAFEQPVGNDPRQRHHVRFWKTDRTDGDGRPVWIGAAVYDQHVGLSRTTGQITHVTAPDVDTERDYLIDCLEKTGDLVDEYAEDDFHSIRQGKNGGGDPWRTDGKLAVGVLKTL